MRLIDADALLEAICAEDVLKVHQCIKLVRQAPTVQREVQEAVGVVVNERGYSEVFVDFFDKPPLPNGTKLFTSPPKQATPDGWISVDDRLPELKDDSVLAHFENGSIETIHIEDYFKPITNGFDEAGKQLYTKWYLHHNPKVSYWQYLPPAPTNTEVGE